ncbi:MAG: class I SAM-dependent methyltransferase [Thermoanaerobaculia bacterium]
MKASTVGTLDRINRDFYRSNAAEFSRTRKRPWPGWKILFERVESSSRERLDPARVSILDLGCGNGRVLPTLSEAFGDRFSYLGLDSSLPLLVEGGRTSAAGVEAARFGAANLGAELRAVRGDRRFDLILAFGLLHHVPSHERRAGLLGNAQGRLRPGGLLAVSFWQFGSHERFRRRFVPWRELPTELGEVDRSDLEPGDHLLAWGDSGALRYCHYTSPEEAETLVRASGLASAARFHADGETGDLNLYYLLGPAGC